MKKEWKSPKISNLDMQYTEGVKPIIYCSNPNARIAPDYSWECPCCRLTSPHIFTSQTEADEDFYGNHLFSCTKYNIATDTCTIS